MSRRLAVVCGALAAGAIATGSTQAPRFSSSVEAVRLDVLVTRDGQPVRGLRPDEFEVRDNGVLQKVDLVSFEEVPLNVVMALDVSASVEGERLDHLGEAVGALVGGLRADDRAGLVTFSHVVAEACHPTGDFAEVRRAIDRVRASGDTSLADGAYAGLVLAESAERRPLLVVFSDGIDSSSWLSPGEVLEAAKRADTVVYAVTTERDRQPQFLRDLTDATGGDLLSVGSTEDVAASFVRILDEFRYRYLVSFTPQGVAKGGWHDLRVRVRRSNVDVRARPGYQAAPGQDSWLQATDYRLPARHAVAAR